jgi:hypothetical protein
LDAACLLVAAIAFYSTEREAFMGLAVLIVFAIALFGVITTIGGFAMPQMPATPKKPCALPVLTSKTRMTVVHSRLPPS